MDEVTMSVGVCVPVCVCVDLRSKSEFKNLTSHLALLLYLVA